MFVFRDAEVLLVPHLLLQRQQIAAKASFRQDDVLACLWTSTVDWLRRCLSFHKGVWNSGVFCIV
jgi:hypothetical protein